MSETTTDDGRTISEAINGFEELYPRQVSGPEWRVLSTRNDGVTAYRVDLEDLDCDCPDQQKNQNDPGVCDHIAVALFADSKRKEFAEYTAYHLGSIVDRAAAAAREVEDLRDVLRASREADVAQATADATDGDETTSTDDPVELLKRALQDANIDPSNVEIWIDDQYGSLQFAADNMPDDDFDRFRSWCQDIDWINWDRDNRRNYIKSDDIAEKLA